MHYSLALPLETDNFQTLSHFHKGSTLVSGSAHCHMHLHRCHRQVNTSHKTKSYTAAVNIAVKSYTEKNVLIINNSKY